MIEMTQDTFVSLYDQVRISTNDHVHHRLSSFQGTEHDVFVLKFPSNDRFLSFVTWHGNKEAAAILELLRTVDGKLLVSDSFHEPLTQRTFRWDMLYHIETLRSIWKDCTLNRRCKVIVPIPDLKASA